MFPTEPQEAPPLQILRVPLKIASPCSQVQQPPQPLLHRLRSLPGPAALHLNQQCSSWNPILPQRLTKRCSCRTCENSILRKGRRREVSATHVKDPDFVPQRFFVLERDTCCNPKIYPRGAYRLFAGPPSSPSQQIVSLDCFCCRLQHQSSCPISILLPVLQPPAELDVWNV
jgi:hypothetical protein